MDLDSDKRKIKILNNSVWRGIARGPVYLLLIFMIACTETQQDTSGEKILALVGDRTIRVKEFIQRAEYTLRPSFCSGDNYIHKKIILNSLIAEKLMAIEAGEQNELMQNADFRAYIEGRKEQAMRQVLYYEQAYRKTNIADTEIDRVMEVARRKYEISWFNIPDKEIADEIAGKFSNEKLRFEEMYRYISGDSLVPQRTVNWEEPENPVIHTALFTDRPPKGAILGPLEISDRHYVFIQVNGWVDQPLMTDYEYVNSRQVVGEKLQNEKAWASYREYVGAIMLNKRMNFHENTFMKLIAMLAPVYTNPKSTRENLFNNAFWNDDKADQNLAELPEKLDAVDHLPFFSVDGEIWTVADFRAYLKRHPLLFRKEVPAASNFPLAFKLAVVDMVRDYYLTRAAYEKGYDKSPIVQQQVQLWQDHMLSIFTKYKYLQSQQVTESNQIKLISGYLAPMIDSLQIRYSDSIHINIGEFEKIQLTRIDMLTLQPDQPFPIVVPSFPLLTDDSRLDYGKTFQ